MDLFESFNYKLAILMAMLIAFALIVGEVFQGKLDLVDLLVYSELETYKSPSLTLIAKGFSHIGGIIGVAAVLALLLVIPQSRETMFIPTGITVLLSVGINLLIKNIFERPRPDLISLVAADGYAFPSGHAMNNMAFYSIIIFIILSKDFGFLTKLITVTTLYLLVICIGFSRIYLGVHSFTDVISGFILGFSVALFVYIMHKPSDDSKSLIMRLR